MTTKPLCRYWLAGTCKFNERCTYRHDADPEGGIEAARKNYPCPFWTRNGKCRHKNCYFLHDTPTNVSPQDEERQAKDPSQQLESEADQSATRSTHVQAKDKTIMTKTKVIISDENYSSRKNTHHGYDKPNTTDKNPTVEIRPNELCGICLSNIPASGKRYGILVQCQHCFCYDCLDKWRKQKRKLKKKQTKNALHQQKHCCPECRVESNFILPSKVYLSGKEKEAVIQEYVKSKSDVPCKKFTGEIGSCPFGAGCFFAHIGMNGEDLKSLDRNLGTDSDNVIVESIHNTATFQSQEDEDDELFSHNFFENITESNTAQTQGNEEFFSHSFFQDLQQLPRPTMTMEESHHDNQLNTIHFDRQSVMNIEDELNRLLGI